MSAGAGLERLAEEVFHCRRKERTKEGITPDPHMNPGTHAAIHPS